MHAFPPAKVAHVVALMVSPAVGSRETSRTKSAFTEPTTTSGGSDAALQAIRCLRLVHSLRLSCGPTRRCWVLRTCPVVVRRGQCDIA